MTAGALQGVTRDSILTLAKEIGLTSSVSDFGREDLYIADEIFLCGTAAGIKPVTEIDHRVVGEGKVGDLTIRIAAKLRGVIEGKDDKCQWNVAYANIIVTITIKTLHLIQNTCSETFIVILKALFHS